MKSLFTVITFVGLVASTCVAVCDAQAIINCIGDFNTTQSTSGIAQSTNAPYDMGSNVNCLWTFKGAPSGQMVIIFVDLLDLTPDCNFTVLNGTSTLPLTPEDLITPLVLAVSAADSAIKLNSGKSMDPQVLRRIMFRWQTTSDPNPSTMFTDYTGVITTPKYLPGRNFPLKLSWVITGQTDTSGIALAFEKFNLGSSGNVLFDVSPAAGPIITLNGSTIPMDILFTSNNVRMNITLPVDQPDLGFKAVYKNVNNVCSHRRKINGTQTFELKSVLSKMPIKCIWIFEGPVNSTLSVTVINVDLPTGVVSNSYLSVHDGGSMFSNTIGLFSGSALQKNDALLSSSNLLWLSYAFHDSNVPNITVEVSVHNDGGILHDADSFGVEPSLINATLPANTSVWSLIVDADKQVKVDFRSLKAEDDERVLFYEGSAPVPDHEIATFVANSTLIPIVSSGNAMFVVAENFKGSSSFNASFEGVSRGNYVLSSSVFASHQLNSIEERSNFTWIIRQENAIATEIIDVTFSVLSIVPNISSLLVYEGLTTNGTLLANVTAISNSSLEVHVSAQQGALIVYSNVGDKPISGVLMDAFYRVTPICMKELNITTGEMRLSSPSYPSQYPVDADCTYSLVTTANKSLLLSFEDVDLADGHFVALMNGSTSVFNLTGNTLPDDYISSNGSRLLIKFVTRSLATNVTRGRGFSVRILALDCGGCVADPEGSINTPDWPTSLKNSTVCVWSIAIPKGKDVGIISLDIEAQAVPASPTVLKFVDGGMLHEGHGTETINTSTTKYLSRTSKLMIFYNYTQIDAKVLGTPYKFTYTTKVCPPSELCMNGICMHSNWKCNGINDCGDFTDEYNCTAGPTIESSGGGVAVATFVVFIFIMFFTGVAVAVVTPNLYRRFRSPRNYQAFGDAVDT